MAPYSDTIKRRSTSFRGTGQTRGWGRGRGGIPGGRAIGMFQRGPLRVNTQPSPYRTAKSFSRTKDLIWRQDLFDDSMAGLSGFEIETGAKLYISNLDYGVSNEDMKELFSEIGHLKHCAVHYDRNGRPRGSAEVVFIRRSDAMAALKRYNNVQLDGRAMKIEIVGTNLGLPVTRVNVVGGAIGRGRRTVVMSPQFGRGGLRSFNRDLGSSREGFQQGRGRGGLGRGRGGPGRGRGRGRGRKQPVEKSANDLDKELETYHAEAMNTS